MASLINRKRDEPPEKKKGDNVTEQQPKKPSTDTENVKSQFEWECEECKQTTYDQTVCSVCVEPLVYRWFEVDDPKFQMGDHREKFIWKYKEIIRGVKERMKPAELVVQIATLGPGQCFGPPASLPRRTRWLFLKEE